MRKALLITIGVLLAGSATAALMFHGASATATADGQVARPGADSPCTAGSPLTPLGLPTGGTSGTAPGRWSAPSVVVPAGTPTESLGLAATAAGSVLAGWVQGPPPMVFAGGLAPAHADGSPTGGRQAEGIQTVAIATGSVLGGVRRSAVLATGPAGSFSNLHVTVAQPNVGYVVWEGRSTSMHVGVLCAGNRVVVNRQLVADAVPLGLFPLTGGRAAVVFDQYGHGTPYLDYGLLSPNGRMGTIARIAHPGPRDSAATELSVSPSGELIAAWVHDDAASAPRTPPSSDRFIPAQLMVAQCRPALQCGSPQTIRLGTTQPACINPAVAISPDNTATVIAAENDWARTGCDKPLGVRESVTAAGSARLRPMRVIQTEGDFPVAEPAESAGTVMVFNSGLAISDAFSTSFLPAAAGAHARTTRLDPGGFVNTGQQLLAPANHGWYVITWSHANRRDNPILTVKAAVGHDGQLQRATVGLDATHHISSYLGATDGQGDAMILFDGSTDTGDGAAFPYTSGLYTTDLPH